MFSDCLHRFDYLLYTFISLHINYEKWYSNHKGSTAVKQAPVHLLMISSCIGKGFFYFCSEPSRLQRFERLKKRFAASFVCCCRATCNLIVWLIRLISRPIPQCLRRTLSFYPLSCHRLCPLSCRLFCCSWLCCPLLCVLGHRRKLCTLPCLYFLFCLFCILFRILYKRLRLFDVFLRLCLRCYIQRRKRVSLFCVFNGFYGLIECVL